VEGRERARGLRLGVSPPASPGASASQRPASSRRSDRCPSLTMADHHSRRLSVSRFDQFCLLLVTGVVCVPWMLVPCDSCTRLHLALRDRSCLAGLAGV
jgi:hypothetical protein